MKKQLWLSLSLILIALSGDCFGGDEVYVSRRYSLSAFRHAGKSSKGANGPLKHFGLIAPKTGLREFNVDDQCGLEECLEEQIPRANWSSKKVELIYEDDEVLIHQTPEVHKEIEALLERLSVALLRPMRLEIRRYKYRGKNAFQSMKVGAQLSVKELLLLNRMIRKKSARLISTETTSLRDGELRMISSRTERGLLYNDSTYFDGVGADAIQLGTGQTTTVSALRSIDGLSIDLKILFEKANLTQLTTQRHGSFFLQTPTVSREFLEAGLRLTWNKPYLIMHDCQGDGGQLVVVQMKKRLGIPSSETMRVFPIRVLDNRWDIPVPRSPWSGMRLGPTTPKNGNDKTSKMDSSFLDRLPEHHAYAMSGLVYLAREDESTLRSDCQKRFDARRVLQAHVWTGDKESSDPSKRVGALQQWSLLSDQALRFGVVTETLSFTGLTRHPKRFGMRHFTEMKVHINPIVTGFSVCLLPEKTSNKTQLSGVVETGRNQFIGLTLWGGQKNVPFQFNSEVLKISLSSKSPGTFTFDRQNQRTTHVELTERDEAKQ